MNHGNRKRVSAYLEMAMMATAVVIVIVMVVGCQAVRGFRYAPDASLSASEARNAAAVARAEASALDSIAAESDATALRFIETGKGLADELGAGGIGAVIGALSTLWVTPPRRRKKTEVVAG